MAVDGHRAHHSCTHHLLGLPDIRSRSDCEERDTEELDMAEEALGVEHGLDGPRLVACNVLHDHTGHEATFRKAAT